MEFKTQRLQQQALRKEIRLKTLEIKTKEDVKNKIKFPQYRRNQIQGNIGVLIQI